MEVGQEFPKYVESGANGDGHHEPAPQIASKPPRRTAGRSPRKPKRPNPFIVFNEFRDHGAIKAGLSVVQFAVWTVLWSHVDGQTGLARISYQVLADKARVSPRTAKDAVASLVELGFVVLVHAVRPPSMLAIPTAFSVLRSAFSVNLSSAANDAVQCGKRLCLVRQLHSFSILPFGKVQQPSPKGEGSAEETSCGRSLCPDGQGPPRPSRNGKNRTPPKRFPAGPPRELSPWLEEPEPFQSS